MFIDHLTPRLEAETGITDVEWFLPSHYHDDHLAGLPTLQVKFRRDEIFSWRDFQFRMEQFPGQT